MPFIGVPNENLATLVAVLDDVCAAAGIDLQSPERQDVAAMVMQFYWRGYRTADGLRQALDEAMAREDAGS